MEVGRDEGSGVVAGDVDGDDDGLGVSEGSGVAEVVGRGVSVGSGVRVGDGDADGDGLGLTPYVLTACSRDMVVELEGMVVFCEAQRYLELPLFASNAFAAVWS